MMEHSGPRILRHDLLIMQQVTAFLSNDFEIFDPEGAVAGTIRTTGDGLSRFMLGSRSLDILDADGTEILHIEDPMDFGFDRYELSLPDGTSVATLRRRMSFLSTRMDVEITGGEALELHGEPLSFDFTFRAGDADIATVSREWGGLGRGLLGHSRYVLSFSPDLPWHARLPMLGCAVALDLVRAKGQRSS